MAIESTFDFHTKSRQQQEWERLSPAEKKHTLYLQQVEVLNLFLTRNNISKAQYDKSLHDLTLKKGDHTSTKE